MLIKGFVSNIRNELTTIKEKLLPSTRTNALKPELVIGDLRIDKGHFLNKLSSCGSSLICVATKKETLDCINQKSNKGFVSSFNWIPLCGNNKELAIILGQAVIYSSFWREEYRFWLDTAGFCVAALFAHTSTLENPRPATAYEVLNTLSPEVNELVNSPNKIASQLAGLFRNADFKLRGQIIEHIKRKLSWLNDSDFKWLTCTNLQQPDFNKLTEQNVCLCLDLTKKDPKEIFSLSALFCNYVFYQLKDDNSENTNHFFIDDLSNVGYMQDLFASHSPIKWCKKGVVLGISSLGELEKLYSQQQVKTALEQCLVVQGH